VADPAALPAQPGTYWLIRPRLGGPCCQRAVCAELGGHVLRLGLRACLGSRAAHAEGIEWRSRQSVRRQVSVPGTAHRLRESARGVRSARVGRTPDTCACDRRGAGSASRVRQTDRVRRRPRVGSRADLRRTKLRPGVSALAGAGNPGDCLYFNCLSASLPGGAPRGHATRLDGPLGTSDPHNHTVFALGERRLMGREGFEPSTLGLRVHENELRRVSFRRKSLQFPKGHDGHREFSASSGLHHGRDLRRDRPLRRNRLRPAATRNYPTNASDRRGCAGARSVV
jgi:hypothetical protein